MIRWKSQVVIVSSFEVVKLYLHINFPFVVMQRHKLAWKVGTCAWDWLDLEVISIPDLSRSQGTEATFLRYSFSTSVRLAFLQYYIVQMNGVIRRHNEPFTLLANLYMFLYISPSFLPYFPSHSLCHFNPLLHVNQYRVDVTWVTVLLQLL